MNFEPILVPWATTGPVPCQTTQVEAATSEPFLLPAPPSVIPAGKPLPVWKPHGQCRPQRIAFVQTFPEKGQVVGSVLPGGALCWGLPGKGPPTGVCVWSQHSLLLPGELGGSEEMVKGQSQRSQVLTNAPTSLPSLVGQACTHKGTLRLFHGRPALWPEQVKI